MFKYSTPCKILLFAHMAARKEELAVQKNSSVYCLMSYQDVTKHIVKFQKSHIHTGTIFDCFFAYLFSSVFFHSPALSFVFINIYNM